MEIVISSEEGNKPVIIFQVIGMINRGSSDLLEQTVKDSLSQGMRYLLIDLSETTSLTSAGLRSLQSTHQMMAEKWASTGEEVPGPKSEYLKLLNPDPQIRRVLEISGFDQLFEIYNDRQESILSF